MLFKYLFLAVALAVCANAEFGVADEPLRSAEDSDPLGMRQFFPASNEGLLNDQISRELEASYIYESMAAYFSRPKVAMKGFAKFFKKSADEERDHSRKFIEYINLRGGKVNFKNIMRPSTQEWDFPMEALKMAFEKEKELNVKLMELRNAADLSKDVHLVSFLEDNFLTEQVDSIQEFRIMIARLEKAGTGLGEYLFDKELA